MSGAFSVRHRDDTAGPSPPNSVAWQPHPRCLDAVGDVPTAQATTASYHVSALRGAADLEDVNGAGVRTAGALEAGCRPAEAIRAGNESARRRHRPGAVPSPRLHGQVRWPEVWLTAVHHPQQGDVPPPAGPSRHRPRPAPVRGHRPRPPPLRPTTTRQPPRRSGATSRPPPHPAPHQRIRPSAHRRKPPKPRGHRKSRATDSPQEHRCPNRRIRSPADFDSARCEFRSSH